MSEKVQPAQSIGKIRQRAVVNALLATILADSLYLLAVVLTTPSISSRAAVSIAMENNWWVLLGITVGVSIQAYLVTYSGATCNLRHRREISGVTGVASGLTSLVSMFSLVSVGCCGTWLYLLSFLPGLLGAGVTAVLIGHGNDFVIAGFAAMGASIYYTYRQIPSSTTKFGSASFVNRDLEAMGPSSH